MPIATTADLIVDVPFPDEPQAPVWQERRTVPTVAFYWVPAALLVLFAVSVDAIALKAVGGFGAVALAVLGVRARRRSLIETYTLSERFLTVEQPEGGRVAIPVESLQRVTLAGEKVRVDSSVGTLTLGYVRGQHSLVRALEALVPGLVVERDLNAFCPT
jgi:hypothetical protein